MTTTLSIRLPKTLQQKAKLKVTREGTSLQRVVEDALKAYVGESAEDPDFDRQMEIARTGMAKYRQALAELAK